MTEPTPPSETVLQTSRLLLRGWRDDDLEPFARMGADPEVMKYFPALLSRQASDALAARARAHLEQHGWGLWAVEVADDSPLAGRFVGFTGLVRQVFPAHFTPAVEVGWRYDRAAWGHGYATEAARAALDFGFGTLGLAEVVSMTAVENRRSRAVMERIGLRRDPLDDFDHPNIAAGHPLRRHVLYRTRDAEPSQR